MSIPLIRADSSGLENIWSSIFIYLPMKCFHSRSARSDKFPPKSQWRIARISFQTKMADYRFVINSNGREIYLSLENVFGSWHWKLFFGIFPTEFIGSRNKYGYQNMSAAVNEQDINNSEMKQKCFFAADDLFARVL